MRRSRWSFAVLVLVLGAAACSSDDASPPATSTTTTTTSAAAPGSQPVAAPATSPAAAVTALLDAEQASDHGASYALLDAASRDEFRTVAQWTRRRREFAPITTYALEDGAGDAGDVLVLVDHEPGLDPFLGLTTARERQTWHTTKVSGGYLVTAEPDVAYVLPDDAGVVPAVDGWLAALQRCDQPAALALQAVPELFGFSQGASEVCGSSATLRSGDVSALQAGPDSADLVAQYSSDALIWARVATVGGGPAPFHVVVAPIADKWKVIAIFD